MFSLSWATYCWYSLLILSYSCLVVESTWSILAIDKTTNQMGSATATCLDAEQFPEEARDFVQYGFSAIPCQGAIQAQANIQDNKGPAARVGLPLLNEGASSVVAAMTTTQAESGQIQYNTPVGILDLDRHDLRQYGVVTYNNVSEAETYTGPELTGLYEAFGFANTEETALAVVTDKYAATIQGNIVFPGTVAATAAAFQNNTACDFAERLFSSLKQGFLETGGDVRCADFSGTKGAVLAFLKVVEPDGSFSVAFDSRIGLSENASALDAIEEELANWRLENPCNESASAVATTPPVCSASSGGDHGRKFWTLRLGLVLLSYWIF